MELTKSQKNAVNKLVTHYVTGDSFCSFKAPTGAGKTFMASSFISEVFANAKETGEKTMVIVATISNAELPKAFAKKLDDYKSFHIYNDYDVEFIASPSASAKSAKSSESIKEFEVKENKVYVFGISSFGKKMIFNKNRTLQTFIAQAKAEGYKLIFIRDEAHIGAKESIEKEESVRFDEIMSQGSDFIIKMTATPKTRENLVELTIEDMSEDGVKLLKESMRKSKQIGEISNQDIINEAISKFIESKKEYASLDNFIIKPAMLIQVMNEKDYEKDPIKNQEFKDGLKILEDSLQKAGLVYLKYLNEKEVVGSSVEATLEYASELDSLIDVVIFKIGPATGWDIPRANTLLQLRNVSSETLNTQILGRIMRNPYPGLKWNHITDKYYVYSNYQKPSRDAAVYQLKEYLLDTKFMSGYINQNDRVVSRNLNKYKEEVIKYLDSSSFINVLKDSTPNDIIYDRNSYGKAKIINKIPNYVNLKIYNINKYKEVGDSLHTELFDKKLESISKELGINIEVIKYHFFNKASILLDMKNKTSSWHHSEDPYNLKEGVSLLENYQIWVDNVEPKEIKTNWIKNYGYYQVTGDENIQYLDSNPELVFIEKIKDLLSQEQKDRISFLAKMPTLGSKIYFEYYSEISGKIAKSYMDFAILFEDKVIMVEVKSKDADYSEEKTDELLFAYSKYMSKFKSKNVNLVLYQYDKIEKSHHLNMMKDGEWVKDIAFREAFDYLLK